MVLSVLTWLYGKLGRFYPAVYLTVELQSAFFVTIGTLALLSVYYDTLADDFLPIGAIALGTTALAVWINLIRSYPLIRPIGRWIAAGRSAEHAQAAWRAAVGLPLRLIQRDMWVPVVVVVLPTTAAAIFFAELPMISALPIFTSALVAVGYGGVLHYLLIETGMRPVLVDVNQSMAPRRHADVPALSLRFKLLATLPLINIITAFVVRGLATEGPGGPGPEIDFMIAVAVATAISLELTVLLSKSILRPISDLQGATAQISEGRYDVSVPVTTGDELGELTASFNEMATGLAERERIREAFGTYLDEEVAEYILSEGFNRDGVEVDVTVLFCDVVDFTSFAARADAREVVACLNRMFEVIVPIVSDHGGHVDKFIGDGLLAVFGAPERMPDHADRALHAALDISRRVNVEPVAGSDGAGRGDGDRGRVDFRVGVGINSGRVVAGAIGGGGRLNFSVIGDAVNVAARVEAMTRATEDDVLVTEDTASRLITAVELVDRGPVELKGVGEVRIFSPVVEAASRDAEPPPPPSPVPGTLGQAR